MDFKQKYLKYKNKYIKLKNQTSGASLVVSNKKKIRIISNVWITVLTLSKLLENSYGDKAKALKNMYLASCGIQQKSCGVAQNIVLDVLRSKYNDDSPKIKLSLLKSFCKHSKEDKIFAINYENFDHVTTLFYHKKSNTYSFFQSYTYIDNREDTGYFLHDYYSEEHRFKNKLLKEKNSFFIDIDIFIQLMETKDNLKYLSKMQNVTFPLVSEFSIILCETNPEPKSKLEFFHEIQKKKKKNYREIYDEVMETFRPIVCKSISKMT